MKFLQKDTWAIIISMVVLFAASTTANIMATKGVGKTQESSSSTSTSSLTSQETSSDSSSEGEIDMSDYVTYFDLAYAAYTNPDKFIDKEITLVGYYSNSLPLSDEASNGESSSTESKSDKTYHFITTYGQVDECHITSEFTTADNKYPEKIGTVIKITGKFTSYEEDGNTYYTIAADTFTTVDT